MDLTNTLCLGIAGNFAHHLEQAGELKDFENIITSESHAPKGIFPFYLPHTQGILGTYCIGTKKLFLPSFQANTQVEPEIAILFDVVYDEDFKVLKLIPQYFTTFNDTTIRKEGAKKISEKKSWGENSKGIGNKWIAIDKFEEGGVMDNYHLASFVKREGKLYEYGVDAPLLGYSYFYTKLQQWLIHQINSQKDFGVLEDIKSLMKLCHYPKTLLVSIGATAYAKFGEENYLKVGDEIYIIAYDKTTGTSSLEKSEGKIILHQKVE